MGLRDRGQDTIEPAVSGYEYDTMVNKRSINMNVLAAELNKRADRGWKLHTALEQDGNLVCIFERAKD